MSTPSRHHRSPHRFKLKALRRTNQTSRHRFKLKALRRTNRTSRRQQPQVAVVRLHLIRTPQVLALLGQRRPRRRQRRGLLVLRRTPNRVLSRALSLRPQAPGTLFSAMTHRNPMPRGRSLTLGRPTKIRPMGHRYDGRRQQPEPDSTATTTAGVNQRTLTERCS